MLINSLSHRDIKRVFAIAFAAGLLAGSSFCVNPAHAQDQPSLTDDLARQLNVKLTSADRKGVLVVDLTNPAGERQAFGQWLADRISLSLARQSSDVEVIDRTGLYATLRDQLPPGGKVDIKIANTLGNSTGANTIVIGSYGMIDNDVGITLVAYRVSEGVSPAMPNHMIAMINGKIPLTNEVHDHMVDPPESLRPKDGIYIPGVGGISMPTCIKCAPPSMHTPDVDVPGLVRDKRGGGDVAIKFVLTAQGRVTYAAISNPIGYGVDEQFLKAATDWEFTPATDPNNNSVPVHMFMIIHFGLRF
jgi:TonB family protein